jgi:hypothetical protein
MTTRPLRYLAHVCKPSLHEKVNNDEVVDEIKGIAYDFKHGFGFNNSDSHSTSEDQTVPSDVTPGSDHTNNGPISIKNFTAEVRAYIKRHHYWCADSELAYVYKTYFNSPHTRFNMIHLAGDIIITKANLERTVNDNFGKIWFEGMLEIILECVCIE